MGISWIHSQIYAIDLRGKCDLYQNNSQLSFLWCHMTVTLSQITSSRAVCTTTDNKENIKALYYLLFVRATPHDQWIPLTKGQWKAFPCHNTIMIHRLNSLAPGRFQFNFRKVILKLTWMVAEVSLMTLPSDECHKTLLMISQHWFK